MNARPEEIVSLLREEIEGYDNKTRRTEEGTVLEVGDGIATIYGLDRAVRSEERRVGKECRSRWSPYH